MTPALEHTTTRMSHQGVTNTTARCFANFGGSTWLCLIKSALLFLLCCTVSCKPEHNSTEPYNNGRATITIAANNGGHVTAGTTNTITVMLPDRYRNANVALDISISRYGFEATWTSVLGLSPAEINTRTVEIEIPNDAIRITIGGYVDWEQQPDLVLSTKVQPLDHYAQFADSISKTNSIDSLTQIPSDDLRTQQAIALRAMELLVEQADTALIVPTALVSYIGRIQHKHTRLLFTALLSLANGTPDWHSCTAVFCETELGNKALNNGQHNTLLFNLLRRYAGKQTVGHVADFITSLILHRNHSTFLQNGAFRLKGLLRNKHYEVISTGLLPYKTDIQCKRLLAFLVESDTTIYTNRVAYNIATIVRGLTDSIAILRSTNANPRSSFQLSLWTSRQISAVGESRALNRVLLGTEFVLPALVMLKTFPRYDIKALGLAQQIAMGYVQRGNPDLANPYYALIYRFYPTDKRPRRYLDGRFPPAITKKQVDSLIKILDDNGLLSREQSAETPLEILASRTLQDQPSVILFTSSYCNPCKEQVQIFTSLKTSGSKFNIIIVMLGSWKPEQREFYETNSAITICNDVPSEYVDNLLINATPTTLVIDKNGLTVMRYDGFVPAEHFSIGQ